MNYYHLLFVAHLAVLITLVAATVCRSFNGGIARTAAGCLLFWSNLVYTALILSVFSKLDNCWLYFGVSITIAFVVWRFAFRSTKEPISLMQENGSPAVLTRTQHVLEYGLIATLALAALCTLTLCVRYQANNWDTLTYRFARVFFYLGHGNLSHFAEHADFRALTYPFNATLVYLFLGVYKLGGQIFDCVSFVFWGMAFAGVYLLARVNRASKFGALVAGWLCVMAPIVLCEGASTNDDMIAAVPLVLGAAFAIRGMSDFNQPCVALAALGFGLGVGAKLHWVFFIPLAPILVFLLALYVLRRRTVWLQDKMLSAKLRGLAIAGTLAVPLAIPSLIYNYVSTGHISEPQLAQQGLNRPFRFDVASQKIWINSAQLFLSSIPDLQIHFDSAERQRTYEKFDQWTNQHWFQGVDQDLAFRMPTYRFQGIADPTGYYYFEQTLWLGFLPVLLFLVLVIGGLSRSVPVRSLIFIAIFFFWHLSFAMTTRYMETTGAYYSYIGVLSCAGLGCAWDALEWRKHIVHKLLICSFMIVIVTDVMIDFNLMVFNVQRNVRTALKVTFDGENGVTQNPRAGGSCDSRCATYSFSAYALGSSSLELYAS